jgi:acylphosphatase
MNDEANSRLHATITGRVQGVSFRYFVLEKAEILDLHGWARNRWDGSVEVTAEGPRHMLELLLQSLREGPSMARVEGVDFEWLPYSGEFDSFRVKSTA